MKSTGSSLDNGQEWLRRWDQMQTSYLPEREKRFQVMLDVLDVLFPGSFVAVDLACGPGSLSQRLLACFPRANCIAVDLDPVLLTLGLSVLGVLQGRLRWSELDIREPGWHTRLGAPAFRTISARNCRTDLAFRTNCARNVLAVYTGAYRG
jgi:predicted RNA methylase